MKGRGKEDLAGRQQEIFHFIEKNPGTHLREMQRRMSVSSMGNLEYHTHNLCKMRVVVEKNEGGYKRYYPVKGAVKNKKMLACMRQKMPRRIAAHIIEKMLRNRCLEIDPDPAPRSSEKTAENEQRGAAQMSGEDAALRSDTGERNPEDCGLTPSEIMDALGIPASSLSYHLTKMDKRGIIRKQRSGKHVYYTLENPEELFRVIVSYRESFADSLVDSFLESWGL